MNVLSPDKQAAIIAALVDGVSIRATERLTDAHRDTITRLGVATGRGCAALHGKFMRNLQVSRIEMDEVWSFVKKKRKNVKETDPETVGDQYIFIAMASTSKAILTWLVGKRTAQNTRRLVEDLRNRVLGSPEISTDGFPAYQSAIDVIFDRARVSYGIVDKKTVIMAGAPESDNYYAKEVLVAIDRTPIFGSPKHISTSYIERQNLTLRQSQRRFTRLTNGFSKKYENHCAAIALYAFHYNFCRVHEALKITPAMQLGVTDHVWGIGEMVQAALDPTAVKSLSRSTGRFAVIQGGRPN